MDLVGAGAPPMNRSEARSVSDADVDPVPLLFRGLCDDAAIFPPGLSPLPAAVDAHLSYRDAWFQGMVGPLVVPASTALEVIPLLTRHSGVGLIVTFPNGPAELPSIIGSGLPVRAVEMTLPDGIDVGDLISDLDRLAVSAFVEVPRDGRAEGVLAALAGTAHRAKFRTGGVRADMYPGLDELAGAIHGAVANGVPFKATAGLHHAIRNTDPQTGFTQHGFLNVMVAANAAAEGASVSVLAEILAEREPETVATWVQNLDTASARSWFVSFGTCSITDPLTELIALGLIEAVDGSTARTGVGR